LAHSVLAIPELRDHTIDLLCESPVDLLACSLVSKAWVWRAQFHLFREITLMPPNDTKLLRLLTKRLEASPHLAHHIRHLKSSLNIHLLRGVMGMLLPMLEEISLLCTKTQHEGHADIETKLLVQSLLCLPTIRRVVLEGWFSSISVIHTYFDDCIQGIRSLELLDVYAPDSDPDPTLASAFAPSKVQLSHVTFPRDCQALDKWITGPQSPFGFCYLQSVHMVVERWQTFRKVLSPSLQSIQYLKLLDCTYYSYLPWTYLCSAQFLATSTWI
jgi:hypothetical protein